MEEFILIVFLVAIYLLPSVLANKKRNFKSIFTLNLFLGWTFLGWIIALIWAVSKDKDDIIILKTESQINIVDQINGLKKLYDEGLITQSEFEQQKQILLNSNTDNN